MIRTRLIIRLKVSARGQVDRAATDIDGAITTRLIAKVRRERDRSPSTARPGTGVLDAQQPTTMLAPLDRSPSRVRVDIFLSM